MRYLDWRTELARIGDKIRALDPTTPIVETRELFQQYIILKALAQRTYDVSTAARVEFTAGEHDYHVLTISSPSLMATANLWRIPPPDLILAARLKTEIEAWISGRRDELIPQVGWKPLLGV